MAELKERAEKSLNKLRGGVDSLIECDLVSEAAGLCSVKY